MMNDLSIFWQNNGPMMGAFGAGSAMSLLFALALVDLALKGWALWRAARMSKQIWFIILLIINSVGILPVIFLLLTNKEYRKTAKKK